MKKVYISDECALVLPINYCPTCNSRIDGATGMKMEEPMEKAPQPGPNDISVCANCGELLVYQRNMKIRLANEADVQDLKQSPDLWNVLQALMEGFRGPFNPMKDHKAKQDVVGRIWQ